MIEKEPSQPTPPGVYAGISNADYHGGPGISKSGLDIIRDRTPSVYRYVTDNPKERTESAAMRIGSAVHAAILEPELFGQEYCLSLRRQDVPEAIEDREELAALVEKLNQERIDAHPSAVRGTDELVARIQELNKGRLPKLSTGGKKDDLVARIVEEVHGGDGEASHELEDMRAGDLKAIIQGENEKRPGLLSTSGDRKALAKLLRDNGEHVELWSEICESFEAEHGFTYTLGTNVSRHAMAEWLNANGVSVQLWSDVKAEWEESNGHRTVLSEEEYHQVVAMRDAVMKHPAARNLLRQKGVAERSVYWVDPETGVLCRCRPDWWVPSKGLLVDVKTTDDASPEAFGRSVMKWSYHRQHPYYVDGCNNAIEQAGLDLPEQRYFVFVVVEKAPPYNVAVYTLDDDSITIGTAEVRESLNTYAECQASGEWPAYSPRVQTVSLPEWHIRRNLPAESAA